MDLAVEDVQGILHGVGIAPVKVYRFKSPT
jgi:hypothetical protein